MASVTSNIEDEDADAVRGLIIQFAEYVATALSNIGLSRFTFPLFRPFNAIFAVTRDRLLCVTSPLTGGVASLRFLDWREGPTQITLEDATRQASTELGWSDQFAFELPASLLKDSAAQRDKSLTSIADGFAQRIRSELEKQQRQVEFHPIFRTKPHEMQIDESLCFVMMPFQPAFTRLYEQVIVPAVEDGGLRPMRADQVFSPSPIVEDIWVSIATARLLIADVTNRNPNVFYELGLAHAVGKPVVIITQSSQDVPFDIAYIRYFNYSDDEAGWSKLRQDLASAIKAVLGGKD